MTDIIVSMQAEESEPPLKYELETMWIKIKKAVLSNKHQKPYLSLFYFLKKIFSNISFLLLKIVVPRLSHITGDFNYLMFPLV